MKMILKILHKLSLLRYVNLTISYPYDKRIKIPIINSVGYEHLHESETWLKSIVHQLHRIIDLPSRYFVDVGANVGQSLLKVKQVDPYIPYIGFEPNPNCLGYLNELTNSNDFGEVKLFPFALSDKTGIVDLNFYSSSETDCAASVQPEFRNNSLRSIKVPVFHGEEVYDFNSIRIGILKIDVEGSELNVIKGLRKWIERDRPVILCEILPVYSHENKIRLSRQREIESILNNLQYTLAQIDAKGKLHQIDSIEIHGDLNRVNYLFFPRECGPINTMVARNSE